MMTVEQAARALRVSPQRIRQRCKRGDFGAVRFGRAWAIPAKEVLKEAKR